MLKELDKLNAFDWLNLRNVASDLSESSPATSPPLLQRLIFTSPSILSTAVLDFRTSIPGLRNEYPLTRIEY